jgi:hypothetical protein
MNLCRSLLINAAFALFPQAGLAQSSPLPMLAPPPAAASSAEAPQPAPPQTLPSVPALPDAPIPISPDLISRLAALRADYADLEQRAAIAATNSPETPEARQKIDSLTATIAMQDTALTLQQWRADTMAYFLADISKRAPGLPEPDWFTWTRGVVLSQVKEPTIAYSAPEAAAGNRLADLAVRAPVLKLGESSDRGWALIWLADQGFGYALLTTIVPVGEAQ